MLTIKNFIFSALLLLAIALSGWSIFIAKKALPSTANQTHQPDAFMENVVTTVMNKEGKPALKVAAPKMVHYAENDMTDITTPHVTVFRQSPQPWYIDSDFGKALNGTEEINFSSHVVIHHPNDSENPLTIMKTATLTVFPDKQTAQTDAAITITQPDATIYAIGMLANLTNGTVQLLSQARGEYVPTS